MKLHDNTAGCMETLQQKLQKLFAEQISLGHASFLLSSRLALLLTN